MDGCLIVHKPSGLTSHDVIGLVRRQYHVKCGHAGTLDPLAQGVLLAACAVDVRPDGVEHAHLGRHDHWIMPGVKQAQFTPGS